MKGFWVAFAATCITFALGTVFFGAAGGLLALPVAMIGGAWAGSYDGRNP